MALHLLLTTVCLIGLLGSGCSRINDFRWDLRQERIPILYEAGATEKAIELAEEHLKISRSHYPPHSRAVRNATVTLALTIQDVPERRKETERLLWLALQIAERQGAERAEIDILNRLGWAIRRNGRQEEAIDIFKRALERSSSVPSRDSSVVAHLYAGIGDAYTQLKEFEQAEVYLKTATNLYQILKDDWQVAACLYRLSDVYRETGRFQEALSADSLAEFLSYGPDQEVWSLDEFLDSVN